MTYFLKHFNYTGNICLLWFWREASRVGLKINNNKTKALRLDRASKACFNLSNVESRNGNEGKIKLSLWCTRVLPMLLNGSTHESDLHCYSKALSLY